MRDNLSTIGSLPVMKISLHMDGSETFVPEAGSLDLCFTSPPYFDTEEYSDEPTQSFRKFPVYMDWLAGFLGKTFMNCHRALRSGGVLAVNVANVKTAPRLVRDTEMMAASAGFSLFETVSLALPRTGRNTYKHEPILVFVKP